MKILIVEDEIVTATDLMNILLKKGYKVLPLCKNFQEVEQVLVSHTPDLLLADIRLKNSSLDGIDIANFVIERHVIPVIYLTSHTDVLTFEKAKSTKPAAYLFKPFRREELTMQIELALEHYKVNKTSASPNPNAEERVFFPVNRGHQKIYKGSVLFIKAEGAYVNIYMIDASAPLMLSMNLGYIVQFFSAPNFYKLSRSFIINLDYVNGFDADFVFFEGSKLQVPIPKAKRQDFLRRFALVKTP